MQPTTEQLLIKNHAETGRSFKVYAYAGSGKTTTMLSACKVASSIPSKFNRPTKGLFLAFNRAIADEASKKLIRLNINTESKTWHKLAILSISNLYRGKLNNLPGAKKKLLSLMDGVAVVPDACVYISKIQAKEKKTNFISSRSLKYCIMSAIENYCSSSDENLEKKHFDSVVPSWVDYQSFKSGVIDKFLFNITVQVWNEIVNPENLDFQLSFSHALKIYQLSKPELSNNYDFLVVDEAQDTDEVALDIINRQDYRKIQIMVVGDSFQQIYQWKGALNALEKVKIKDTVYLSKSFRFGQDLADFASCVLYEHFGTALKKKVQGSEFVQTKVLEVKKNYNYENADAIITRTNIGAFEVFLKLREDYKHLNVNLNIDLSSINTFLIAYERLSLRKELDPKSPLAIFSNLSELEEYIYHGTTDSEITTPYNLIKKFGLSKIKSALKNLEYKTINGNGLVVTTAHKSKGLEYGVVLIHSDFNNFIFKEIDKSKNENNNKYIYAPKSDEEARLFYVAITRAKKILVLENFYIDIYDYLIKNNLYKINKLV